MWMREFKGTVDVQEGIWLGTKTEMMPVGGIKVT